MTTARSASPAAPVDGATAPAPAGGPAGGPVRTPRIPALDVVRGVALCGILLVNIEPVTRFGYAVPHGGATLDDPSGWLQLLVQQRFFPVFSLLFGMSASLLVRSAQRRGERARVVLARRLLVLLPLGLLHLLLHPGEALTFYAIFGLLVLLPSTWLPRWAVALAAAVLLPLSLVLTSGGLVLIPSLFLLGSALVRYGVVDRLGSTTRGPALLLPVFAVVAAPALVLQLQDLPSSGFTTSSAVAGLALAGVWVCGVLLLLRTRLRQALERAFSPLGRMALTNYVAATPVVVLVGHLLDWQHSESWGQVLGVAVAVLVGQWGSSALWLRRYRQGPLEWLWRSATWAEVQPLRRV